MGFLQAGSLMSLYAGGAAGIFAISSYILCRKGYNNIGLKLLTAVSLGLSILFIKRFQATGNLMPSGFMALNSAVVLFIALIASKQLSISPNKTE